MRLSFSCRYSLLLGLFYARRLRAKPPNVILASQSLHGLYKDCRSSGDQFFALRDIILQARFHGLVICLDDLGSDIFGGGSEDMFKPRFILISVCLLPLMIPILKTAIQLREAVLKILRK